MYSRLRRSPSTLMKTVDRILRAHPRAQSPALEEINACTDALLACIEACTICADGCLAEPRVDQMRRCIRANQDCADICTASMRLIVRQTETIAEMVRQQVHASVFACQLCAEECERHDAAYCRLCAAACRRCQEACNRMLGQISASGVITAEQVEASDIVP